MKEYEFTGTIGDDTEVKLLCEWTPPQREILYPNDKAQPGFPAELSIYSVLLNGDDLFDDLSDQCKVRLEEAAQEQLDAMCEP